MPPALRPYDFTSRKAESLGTMWTMRKGPRTVVCMLATHRLGWELTIALDGDAIPSQSRVCYTEEDVFTESAMLQGVWGGKGWV